MFTLTQAIESGRVFRHASWSVWYFWDGAVLQPLDADGVAITTLSIDLATSHRWIVHTDYANSRPAATQVPLHQSYVI